MSKLKSFNKYLIKKNNQLIYNHDVDLEVLFPKYFLENDWVKFQNVVNFMAIVQLTIGNEQGVLILPSLITSDPSNIREEEDNYILTYKKGDRFLVKKILQDQAILYKLFNNFCVLGKIPFYIKYEDLPNVFKNACRVTNTDLHARDSVFELIFANLTRNPDNLFERYRNTDMSKPFTTVSSSDLIHNASSVIAKISGNFLRDGLVASTINENKKPYLIENLMVS